MPLGLRRLFVLILLGVAALASAQMVPSETIDSIDVRMLNAKAIAVGRVVAVAARTATIAVDETIKGKAARRLRFAPRVPAEVLEGWKARSARLLVDVPTRARAEEANAVALDVPDLLLPTADFTTLRNPVQAVLYVRDLVRDNPGVERIDSFVLPRPEGTSPHGPWPGRNVGSVRVPVDKRLERRARAMVYAQDPWYRLAGVRALRLFKSDENAALLIPLLKDSYTQLRGLAHENNGVETHVFPLRTAAYETLRAWGRRVERPVLERRESKLLEMREMSWTGVLTDADLAELGRSKVLAGLSLAWIKAPYPKDLATKVAKLKGLTRLSLPPMSADDAALRSLSGLTALESLGLDNNAITDAGLEEIARSFASLTNLRVEGTRVTDAGLAALRRARPQMWVSPAKAPTIKDPKPSAAL